MATIDVQGYELEYLETGAGDPVVLVHGSASDLRTWGRLQEALAARYRTISYSRRYHWPNRPTPPGADYAMLPHAADLGEIVRSFRAAPAHLVGHSYGAFLCLLLALEEPGLVRSLVLAEPPVLTLFVSPRPRTLELLKVLVTRPRTAAAIVRFGAGGVAPAGRAFREGRDEDGMRIFGEAVFGPGGFARLPAGRKVQVRDNLPNVKAEVFGSDFAPLDTDRVRALRVPVLLVHGGRSLGLFHRLMDRLQELMPHAERVEIPGASHMMHEDDPEAFRRAVEEFLSRHGVERA